MQTLKLAALILTPAAASLVLAGSASAEADTSPPVLAVPKDMRYHLKDPRAIVRMTYAVGVQDDTDPRPKASCTPRSGSTFPVGTTKVTCTAEDASGNRSSASFKITVSTKPGSTARRTTQTPKLAVRAYRQNAQGTWLVGAKVTRVAKGTSVKVACNRRCPSVLRSPVTLTSRGTSVNLAALLEYAAFKIGTTITVTASGSGVRTQRSRILIRAHKAPLVLS